MADFGGRDLVGCTSSGGARVQGCSACPPCMKIGRDSGPPR